MNETNSKAKSRMLYEAVTNHREELLALPGVRALAVGRKEVQGKPTGELSVVVFVERKLPERETARHTVRRHLPENVPSDVVERKFGAVELATDPALRYEPMQCGLSIATRAKPNCRGSIGCFIEIEENKKIGIEKGRKYLLTNEHVISSAGHGGEILQPHCLLKNEIPDNTVCGTYLCGLKDSTHDCAIVAVHPNRTGVNKVQVGTADALASLAGFGDPEVGQAVYKFAASTGYTTGFVTLLNLTTPDWTDVVYIETNNKTAWTGDGDSGSVAIVEIDGAHFIVALNWAGDGERPVEGKPGFYQAGMAYPIRHQLETFGIVVRLATPP